MAAKTFAIDNGGPYDVIAVDFCRRITIQEDYDSATPPTADLKMYQPKGGTGPVKVAQGTPAVFSTNGTFYPGQVVGQIQTRSGSITVQQVESGQV